LIGLLTPKESLRFACRLRTTMTEVQIRERVDVIIERMSLQKCENTLIGGGMIKGISGGERKRVAIGYELITDPQFLLLDEPTSGLDSFTAYNVIKSLKDNAKEGMTIMCTIHSPSSKTFELFDTLILMHEGQLIYQGPTTGLATYFSEMGI
jgi:ABC-type multidrug transport system ATPase subunit